MSDISIKSALKRQIATLGGLEAAAELMGMGKSHIHRLADINTRDHCARRCRQDRRDSG